MKRSAWVWLAVSCLVIAGVLWQGKFRRRNTVAAHSAELVPADAMLFVQVNDVKGSLGRWDETALAKVWKEPEVQAFVAEARAQKALGFQWATALAKAGEFEAGEMFFAVTGYYGNRVQWVGGISMAGSREEWEPVFGSALELFAGGDRKNSRTKRGIVGKDGIQLLEQDSGAILAGVAVQDWYLVGNDLPVLQKVMERANGGKPAGGGRVLAENPGFLKAIGHLPVKRDLLVYGELEAIRARVGEAFGAGGTPQDLKEKTGGAGLRPIAAAMTINGLQFEDVVYIPDSAGDSIGSGKSKPLEGKTKALAGGSTLLFSAVRTPVSDVLLREDGYSVLEPLRQRLARCEISAEALDKVLGEETAIVVDWEEGAMQPSVLLAANLESPEQAGKLLERLLGKTKNAPGWNRKRMNETVVYSMPVEKTALLRPTIAVGSGYLLYGLGPDSVEKGLDRLAAPEERRQNAAETAMAGPGGAGASAEGVGAGLAMGYVDMEALVARAYGAFRPVIEVSLGLSPGWNRYLDAAKLPSPGALSRHMGRSEFRQRRVEGGTQLESAGVLTVNQVLVGGTAALVIGGWPGGGEGGEKEIGGNGEHQGGKGEHGESGGNPARKEGSGR